MNQHCYCNVLFAQQKCVTMATQFVVNIDSPHLKAIKHSPWRIRFYVLFIFRSSLFFPTMFFNHRNALPSSPFAFSYNDFPIRKVSRNARNSHGLLCHFFILIQRRISWRQVSRTARRAQCCNAIKYVVYCRGAVGVWGNINAHHTDLVFDQVEDMKIDMARRSKV